MCNKRSTTKFVLPDRDKPIKIDKCLQNILSFINYHSTYRSLGSCCGHGKYPMTIIVQQRKPKGEPLELFSGIVIPRKRRFYVTDDEGFYYIPELKKGLVTIADSKGYETHEFLNNHKPMKITDSGLKKLMRLQKKFQREIKA